MPTLNDHKLQALRNELLVPDGQTLDLERQFLITQIAVTPPAGTFAISDLWHLFWDEAFIGPGHWNDRAYEWLGTKLETDPALNERWFGYWAGLSGLSP